MGDDEGRGGAEALTVVTKTPLQKLPRQQPTDKVYVPDTSAMNVPPSDPQAISVYENGGLTPAM
jgi:hypothetical protein